MSDDSADDAQHLWRRRLLASRRSGRTEFDQLAPAWPRPPPPPEEAPSCPLSRTSRVVGVEGVAMVGTRVTQLSFLTTARIR